MNTALVLIEASSTLAMFSLAFIAVLGFKSLAAWMKSLEMRDVKRAEAEGAKAALLGEPGTANPYVKESTERFKAMAEAWARGWVKKSRVI